MGIENITPEHIELAAQSTKKLTENSKTEDIVNYLDTFKKSTSGEKLRKMFNKFSDKDKMTLYKDGAPTLLKMGILDNPWIPKEDLINNVKKDAKSMKIFITALQMVITAVAPEAEPLIASLKAAIKTLVTKAEDIATQQMEKNEESVEEIEEETKNDLQENLDDIEQKAA